MNTIERVTELLDARHMSFLQLSELCDVPYVTLKAAKRRNTQLSVDTIERICSGLSISMSEFFTEEESKHDS